jgi:hypothetical protein
VTNHDPTRHAASGIDHPAYGGRQSTIMQLYDLATDKDGDLISKPEKSERALMKVMRRCQKPITLSIDDGHDLATFPPVRPTCMPKHCGASNSSSKRRGTLAGVRRWSSPGIRGSKTSSAGADTSADTVAQASGGKGRLIFLY